MAALLNLRRIGSALLRSGRLLADIQAWCSVFSSSGSQRLLCRNRPSALRMFRKIGPTAFSFKGFACAEKNAERSNGLLRFRRNTRVA